MGELSDIPFGLLNSVVEVEELQATIFQRLNDRHVADTLIFDSTLNVPGLLKLRLDPLFPPRKRMFQWQ